jgi:hypothetical protein
VFQGAHVGGCGAAQHITAQHTTELDSPAQGVVCWGLLERLTAEQPDAQVQQLLAKRGVIMGLSAGVRQSRLSQPCTWVVRWVGCSAAQQGQLGIRMHSVIDNHVAFNSC